MSEKTLLSYFWDLASTNEKIRIDAAVNLIQYLKSGKDYVSYFCIFLVFFRSTFHKNVETLLCSRSFRICLISTS